MQGQTALLGEAGPQRAKTRESARIIEIKQYLSNITTTHPSPIENRYYPIIHYLYIPVLHRSIMDFDETRLYFSHQQLQRKETIEDEQDEAAPIVDEDAVDLQAVRRHFREFLSAYSIMLYYIIMLCRMEVK